MPVSADFRRAARGHLKGHFAEMLAALGVFACVMLILSVVQDFTRAMLGVNVLSLYTPPVGAADFYSQYLPNLCIAAGSALFTLLLTQPLLIGVRRLFWRAVNDKHSGLSGLFADFSSGRRYARALSFSVQLYLRYILFSLLMLPGLALVSIGNSSTSVQDWFNISLPTQDIKDFGAGFGTVLLLIGAVLFVRLMLRYFLARVLLADDDSLSPREALRRSARAMNGYKGQLVSLILSYAGWFLFCVPVLPILYVAPYVNMSCTSFARFAVEENVRAGRLPCRRQPEAIPFAPFQPAPFYAPPGDFPAPYVPPPPAR